MWAEAHLETLGAREKMATRFEFLREIGQGGLGSVYRGNDRETNQQVAIKMLPHSAGDPPYLVHEYDVLSHLSHPNIVHVIDSFHFDGRLCFAMEMIDGVTLDRALEHEPKSCLSNNARRVFGQLHDALEYLHESGIVHGELFHGNILISSEGVLKIVDFELARRRDGRDSELFPPGVFMGIPIYSSPEHFTGGTLLPESDYFVVGILLAEHLVRAHPFSVAKFPEILRQIATAEFRPDFAIDSIEPVIREVIARLVSVDLARRREGWELLREQTRLDAVERSARRPDATSNLLPDKGVFISHASADKPVARRIARELSDAGLAVWLDEWRIKPGESVSRSIDDALESCSHVLLLLSTSAVRSPWVEREWRAAYWKEIESARVFLIPVLVSQCAIPPLLRDKKYVSLNIWEEAIAELLEAITGA